MIFSTAPVLHLISMSETHISHALQLSISSIHNGANSPTPKKQKYVFCPANCQKKSNAFSHHLPAQRVLWLCEAGFATKRLILILIGHLGDQRESVSEKIHGPCKAYDKLSRIAGWWLVVLKNISQWVDYPIYIYILWKIKKNV